MRWGIIAAMDAELELILAAMQTEHVTKAYGVEFNIGRIGGSRVVAVCSSVGTINAAACASVLAREMEVDAIVNIGVAGGADSELDVLDVAVSSEVVFHDSQSEILVKYYPYRESFTADTGLIALAEQSIAGLPERGFNYKIGRIATGDVFVSDPALKAKITAEHAPLCVEMEGAAIGQVAYMSGLPFLVIRSISDRSDGEAKVSFDQFLPRAAKNSAGIVLGMISLSG